MLREVRDMIALRSNGAGSTRGLVGGAGRVLSVTTDGSADKIAVIHRWSDGAGKSSNDVIVVYNMRRQSYPAFQLTDVPYDGEWTVQFDGDSEAYSELYDQACRQRQVARASGGVASVCVPPMSMLVLSRA
jgi:hypothetical protein